MYTDSTFPSPCQIGPPIRGRPRPFKCLVRLLCRDSNTSGYFTRTLSATYRTTRGNRGSRTKKNKLARPPSSCHSVVKAVNIRERRMKPAMLLIAQGDQSPTHPAGYVRGRTIVLSWSDLSLMSWYFFSFFTSIVSNESHTGPLCFLSLEIRSGP